MRKRLKETKRIIAFFLMALMLVGMLPSLVMAADVAPAVLDARNGIFQINVCHVDATTGQSVLIQSGSGFLIGDSMAGAQTILTNYHVVNLDEDTENAAKAYLGVSELNIRYEIVVKRDVIVYASIVNQSAAADFAILTLNTPIYGRQTLKLADDSFVTETMNVYALGFPSVLSYVQDDAYYTSDDVNVSAGSVSKKTQLNSLPYIQHSATLSSGNSGGPLLDSNGNVLGINTYSKDDMYFYSLQIDEVREILDALGIYYETASTGSTNVPQETTASAPQETQTQTQAQTQEQTTSSGTLTAASADKSKLQTLVDEFYDCDSSEYSADTYSEYKNAVTAARDVLQNSNASQSDVDSAVANVKAAKMLLEPAGSSNMMLYIIIGAAVVVVIIVVIVIVAVSSGKKKTAPVPQPYTNGGMTPPPVPPAPPVYPSSGSEGTTVLGPGSGEGTTVLSASNQTPAALLRLKTNENITINKATFRLGKERNKVDYCITNNGSVSRQHANIIYRNGQYFIVDLNSTNSTYVNGQTITPNTEVKLNPNDRIKLADEEFMFR